LQSRKEVEMTSRLLRIAAIWMLILATAWVARPYLIAIWASAEGPRTVTPRGDLTQAERATIKLFQTVSPSVVHVFAQGSEQSFFLMNSGKASFNPGPVSYGMPRGT
jgi:2-alkenal reductase